MAVLMRFMVMIVRMRMIVVMVAVTMMVMMSMIVPMTVCVIMLMVIIVMMDALARPRSARIFAEHQRLDRHRHRVGRHADAAEVDVVEVPQHDAVDDQK